MSKILTSIWLLFIAFNAVAQDGNQDPATPVPYSDKKGKYGYKLGKDIVITCEYLEADFFKEGLAVVTKEIKNKYGYKHILSGYINTKGETVINLRYAKATPFEDGLAIVQVVTPDTPLGTWMVINTKGEVLFKLKSDVYEMKGFSKGYAMYKTYKSTFGYIDRTGNSIGELELENADNFNTDGIAFIRDKAGVRKMDTSFMDISTKEYVFPKKWTAGSNGKYGLMLGQRVFVTPVYDEVVPYANNYAAVRNGKKWGIVNGDGKEIVPARFDAVSDFRGNYALVEQNEKYGIYSKRGEEVVPPIYTVVYLPWKDAPTFLSANFFMVNLNGKKGYLFENGKQATPLFYNISTFSNGLAYVYPDNEQKWKYINTKGKFIDETEGNLLETFQTTCGTLETFKPVQNTFFKGVGLRNNGKLVLFPFFESVTVKDDMVICKKDKYTTQIAVKKLCLKNGDDIEQNEKLVRDCDACKGSGSYQYTESVKGGTISETSTVTSSSVESKWNPRTNSYDYVTTKKTQPITTTRQAPGREVTSSKTCAFCKGTGKKTTAFNSHLVWDKSNLQYLVGE